MACFDLIRSFRVGVFGCDAQKFQAFRTFRLSFARLTGMWPLKSRFEAEDPLMCR